MRPLRYLNKYFLKYKGRLLLGILFVTISNIYAIVPAKMVRVTFDFLSDIRSINILFEGSFLQDEFKSEWATVFLLFAGLIIGAVLLKGMFMFFMRMTLVVMSRLIEYDLKNEIFAKYQGLSLAFYKRNNTGDLMARIHEDVSKVRMYIGPAILYAVNLSVLVVLIIGNMLNVSVKLTMFVLIPLPILSFTIFYVSQRINVQSEKVQRQLSALSTFVQEAFSGIRVLKSYTKESQWEKKFGIETDKYRQASMELVKINAIFFPTMIVLIGLSTLLTIYIGGQEVYAGNISTGNIAEFVIYINQLTWPVAAIGWVTSIIQRAAASQKRINEFLEEETDIVLAENTIPEDIEGAIKFKNVSLTYPDSGIVALKNINLTVEKGSSLAILGRTGSGKSTVAALITRTYDPTNGTVEIDEMDLRFMDLESM
ncbi:MAG: ATP-binding cassette subfamily B multidrug efflux pump, partial [Flavobacteriales bacterium]